MANVIVKLREHYFEYSTIVDAPITFGMERSDFEEYYKSRYGEKEMEGLASRLERADKNGTSALYTQESAEEYMRGNRAGPNESSLTSDEIYKVYCLQEPINGWKPR